MKKLLVLITLSLTVSSRADTNAIIKADIISFAQLTANNRTIEFAVYPLYAPSISVGGKKDTLGAGFAMLTPATVVSAWTNNTLAQHAFVGLRFDYIAHQAFASTVAVGMKGDVQLWGHNFTGFAHSGVNIPITGFGNNDVNVGAMVGGGFYTSIYQFSKHGGIGIQASVEKWTQFSGFEFLGGPVVNLSF